jgi:hypothetical protein
VLIIEITAVVLLAVTGWLMRGSADPRSMRAVVAGGL